jgi:IS1 family transposase
MGPDKEWLFTAFHRGQNVTDRAVAWMFGGRSAVALRLWRTSCELARSIRGFHFGG